MKYKFCSIRINVTKYVITFAIPTSPSPRVYATGVEINQQICLLFLWGSGISSIRFGSLVST